MTRPIFLVRCALAVLTLASSAVIAQPESPRVAPPPAKDGFIYQLTATENFNAGRPKLVHITPDERSVLFLRSHRDSNVQSLFSYDVASGQARELLSPDALLGRAQETLSPEERARRERMRMYSRGFTSYALSPDGERVLLTLSGRLYVLDRASGKTRALAVEPGAIDPQFSPDGRQVAYVRGQDVFRVDLTDGRERRVTRGGTPQQSHGLAEFVALEEMGRFSGYWWSPDSRRIAYAEVDTRDVETLNLSDPAHPERPPNLVAYPRAGRANAKVRLFVTAISGGPPRQVRWDSERYPYLATVRWPEKGPLTLLVQNRAQTEMVLLAADPDSGRTKSLVTERDEAWLDLQQQFPRWLKSGRGFLWHTERHGAPEVELRAADGRLVRSLVPPSAGFRALVGYLEDEDTVFFVGGPNPTERYLWRITRGGAPTRMTSGGPALELAAASDRGGLFVVGSEGPQSLRRYLVMRPDGSRLGELPSAAREPSLRPRFEVRPVGPEGFWASIVRPRDFKPGVKLPVIVEVYGAGPPLVAQSMERHLASQWMADHGFLVVSFDGRGTMGRGRDWERRTKFDHGPLALEDQVSALRALAAEMPEVDLSRVGITGWSNGGYMSALAVLTRPDVFKAAAAGGTVADWRGYDSHLTERFLGLPQEHPEAYERNSLLTYVRADRPMGKLLLMHGTADDNVFFSNTLALADALLRAGKPFELIPLSGSTHRVVDPELAERLWERVMAFFQANL